MIYNVLISSVEESDSVLYIYTHTYTYIHTYIYILFHIVFLMLYNRPLLTISMPVEVWEVIESSVECLECQWMASTP